MPDSEKKRVTVDEVRRDHEVKVFIAKANENLGILGYTEHGPRHASLVADIAENVLLRLGFTERQAELAAALEARRQLDVERLAVAERDALRLQGGGVA